MTNIMNNDGMMNKLDAPLSRRSILKNAGVGAAALAVAGVPLSLLSSSAQAQSSTTAYTAILNLKYLTKALYDKGGALATPSPTSDKNIFNAASAHEAAHITLLKSWIGSGAPDAPASFNFKGDTGVTGSTAFDPFPLVGGYDSSSFYLLASLCEDLAVRAIKSQISVQFGNAAQVTLLAQMQSVDARHAAQMRLLGSMSPLINSVPASGGENTSSTYFKWLVYGPKESDTTTHPASNGEDNIVQYNGAIVAGTASVFDEPLHDFAKLTEFLGYFA